LKSRDHSCFQFDYQWFHYHHFVLFREHTFHFWFYLSSVFSRSLSIIFTFFVSFLFRGFLSLKPIGRPRFKRALDVLATSFSFEISIQAGTFIAGTCDFVTFFKAVNESGSWFVNSCKFTIFFTFYSHDLLYGSKCNKCGTCHVISFSNGLFSPPSVGNFVSSKWQSTNLA